MNQQNHHQGHSSYQSQQWSTSSYYQQGAQEQAPPAVYQQTEYQQQATPQIAYQQQGYAQQTTPQVTYQQQGYSQQAAPQVTYPQSAQQTHGQQNEATTTTTVYEYDVPQPACQYPYPSQTPAVAYTAPVAQPQIQTQASTAQYAQQTQTPAPVPVQSPQQSTIDYTSLVSQFEGLASPSQTQPPPQTRATIETAAPTARVETYEGEHAGGRARREAEAQGPRALRQYERRVERYLAEAVCESGSPWYNGIDGYACEGGSHFMSHAAIDAAMYSRDPLGPRVEHSNFWELSCLAEYALAEGEALGREQWAVHPPPFPGWEMGRHLDYKRFVAEEGGVALSGIDGDGKSYGAPCECVRYLDIPVVDRVDGDEVIGRRRFRRQGAFKVVWPARVIRRAMRGRMYE